MQPWVVKLGGALAEQRDSIAMLSRACALHPGPLVLVHGGGAEVSRLQRALGLEPRFEGGRRVTGAADLPVVEMALSGAANKTIVRAMQSAGRAAVGLSGCDGGLVRCARIDALGHVGRPVRADARVLEALLAAGFTPVISPVSLDLQGEPVNVNADEIGAALAIALRAERLLLLSDVQGVRVLARWRTAIEARNVEALIAAGEVTGGMIPKLRAAARAVVHGVAEVRIGSFTGGRLVDVDGTRVGSRRATEPAEPATSAESGGAEPRMIFESEA